MIAMCGNGFLSMLRTTVKLGLTVVDSVLRILRILLSYYHVLINHLISTIASLQAGERTMSVIAINFNLGYIYASDGAVVMRDNEQGKFTKVTDRI